VGSDRGDAIVTSDVGQHQMWAAQYYKFDKPRRWLNSGGLGTMGVGMPYAMGAQLAHPGSTGRLRDRRGSIQMCIQELSTCKQYRMPIKICNLNNRYLGMVRQWQELFHGNRYSESYMDALPDFVKLAEAYGHVGMRIDKPAMSRRAARSFRHARTISCSWTSSPTRPRTCTRWSGRQGPHRDDPPRSARQKYGTPAAPWAASGQRAPAPEFRQRLSGIRS
jgi:thiamine pyrophosphate-dependent acetolactate synthase large subunit-like protein